MASLSDHSRARSPFLFVPSQLSSQAPNARVNTSPVPVQAHNENIDASRLGRYAAQLHVPPLSTKPTWQVSQLPDPNSLYGHTR